ncbi:MAG: hypothetical protein SF339_26895, partial [Blastocatellia bacterium]|nr:hypothetical protein [Blastocatellia bacterium]
TKDIDARKLLVRAQDWLRSVYANDAGMEREMFRQGGEFFWNRFVGLCYTLSIGLLSARML